jgi:hypothetical protein
VAFDRVWLFAVPVMGTECNTGQTGQ